MPYARKVDTNHVELVKTFRSMGATVLDLSKVGKGCPDLLIGINNRIALVEIKRDDKAKYTNDQIKFMQNWKGGTIARIQDLEGATRLINLLKS